MWIIRITLDLYGDKFSPKEFLKDLTDIVQIFDANEPDDLNDKNASGIFGFGSLSILCPQVYGLQYEMTEYENWYLDFIDRNKKLFDKNWITEINLFLSIFHNGGQLNFEILSRELLKKVGHYGIAIPISYYKLTTEQIIEMLKETKLSKERLKEYVDVG